VSGWVGVLKGLSILFLGGFFPKFPSNAPALLLLGSEILLCSPQPGPARKNKIRIRNRIRVRDRDMSRVKGMVRNTTKV
jgi:hypothetical protein